MLTESGITFTRCILCLGKTDLRKGIDGLAARIRLQYGLEPLEKGTLFLFCGTRKDRLKGLLWCGDRFILLYICITTKEFMSRSSLLALSMTLKGYLMRKNSSPGAIFPGLCCPA